MDLFQAIALDAAGSLVDVNRAQLQQNLLPSSKVSFISAILQFFQLLFRVYESCIFCLLYENLIVFLD